MEERDNIVSQLQRLFSPQPDPRVSDPQTVAEASRIAAAGLLSENVATDAQDQTANLVPVTGPRGAFEAATRDEATEHAASDIWSGTRGVKGDVTVQPARINYGTHAARSSCAVIAL